MKVEGYPSIPALLDRLREGISHEHPEAGVLFHEASFIPGYREHIGPEEALRALQMAATWGHPSAMKRLSSLYEQGVGVPKADPTLALALLLGRDRYKHESDPNALDAANRIAATLTPQQREMAEFSAKAWRPGGLMVLFDPEKWDQSD
jgi:TPR repeat protein